MGPDLKPSLVEVVTWNDYSESTYLASLRPNDTAVYAGASPDGTIDFVADMPHGELFCIPVEYVSLARVMPDAFRSLVAVYAPAYKQGLSSPIVQQESIIYWHRPYPKDVTCSDALAQPNGYTLVEDAVFAAALVTDSATATLQLGAATQTFSVTSGVNLMSM